jgi:glycerol-3-phosphate dehydrogenase
MQDDLDYVWAEVEFAIADDLARTLTDILARRIPLVLVGRDQGLDVAERVAARAAELLGWTGDEVAKQLAAYRREVAGSRRFRS